MPETTPPAPTPNGEEIGQVVGFFAIPNVAMVKLKQGTLRLNDKIWIHGHTTDLIETVASMQVNRQPVSEAKEGDEVGIKLSGKARQHDRVYKIA